MKTRFSLFLLSGFLTTLAYAGSNWTAIEQAEIVAAHNKWRSAVHTPPLSWSNALADTAQTYANHLQTAQACKMIHSKAANLGENLFWASAVIYSNGNTKIQPVFPTQVVDDWGSENVNYLYLSNSCKTGKVCGHYTQIVWNSTTQVGCGKAICADNSQIWVCNYTPAGNFINQKPY